MSSIALSRRVGAEVIGTFLLLFFGAGAVMTDAIRGHIGLLGISLAFGIAVATAIVCFGNVSGAHINPAVTITFWTRGLISSRDALAYIAAQCAGATAAALVLRGLLGPVAYVGATIPQLPAGASLAVEILLSFGLMYTIMAASADPLRASAAPFIIGGVVGLCALMGGPLTGASMNPARSLGPALASGTWDGHWIYWVGPIGGMWLAGRVYDWLREA